MQAEELRILVLEDADVDAELCREELARAGMHCVLHRVDTRADFERALDGFLPDLILSDFTLPGSFDGLAALEIALARSPGTPFVFLSGTIGEERAVEAIRRGAADWVLKENMARLGPAVEQALQQAELRRAVTRAETALRESEGKYHGLIEQASDGIFVTDTRGNFLLVNSRFCEMLGYTREELLGLNVADTYPHEERNDILKRLPQLAQVKSKLLERLLRGKDGRVFPAEISVRYTPEGTHQGIARDITERRQHEDRIARLNRVHAVLSSINSAIVRVRERSALLDEACRIAVEHGRFGIAWIGTLNPQSREVVPVAWAGLDPESFLPGVKSSAREDHPLGRGVVGRALREGAEIFSNDLLADGERVGFRAQEAVRRGYRSRIALPLRMSGEICGIMVLFAREKDFFNDEELGLLKELAGNISYALEHIARQENVEKLSRMRAVSSEINIAIVRMRERDALLREACRIASERGGFEMTWVGATDEEKKTVKPVAWTGFSAETAHAVTWQTISGVGGPLGEAIRTRKVAVRNDIESELVSGNLRREALQRGCRSTVCVPLVEDGRVVALASLYATGRSFFDPDEVALLEELSSNISFALESIARQEKIDRLSRIRSVLGEINAAIVRIRDRQALFEEACRIVVEAGRFKFAWLGVVERDARQIRPAAHAGAGEGFLDNMWPSLDATGPRGPGLSARAILERTPVIVNDTQTDPRILRRQDHRARNINSIAMFPLITGDEPYGLLALHAAERGFFDEEEVKLLSELAGDIAFALQTIEKEEQLQYLSYYDPLTGLPNRTLFLDRIGQQLRARGGETPRVAVVLVNLQRFRNINETFGRHGGDELLKQVSRRLEEAFAGKDHLARTAADGFGIIVRGLGDAALVAESVDARILECFRSPFVLSGSEVRVAARAGIALFPSDGGDADTLFKNAEAALKRAQDSAERFVFYAAEMTAQAALVLSLETRLRKAVEARQFVLYYQPKVGIPSGAVCGLEALIRWQEPGAGLVAPGTFIPVLEETGLILEVGNWVLRQALADHREWTARGCATPRIAVNVSAIQLHQQSFADGVIQAVHETGDSTSALELEVTESLLMKDVEGSIRKLSVLRATGIHVAMDDFGTGYSSLAYIARLPINSVKIDRSFVSGMTGNDQDMAIVTTIVTLSHSLNLRVVAEGVETEAQARLLALLKCDEAQGYFFGRPMPAAEIEAWLRSHGRPAAPPAADAAGETKGAAPRASKRRAGTAQPRSRRPRK